MIDEVRADAPVPDVAVDASSMLAADAASRARRIEEAGLNNLHTRRQLIYDGWLLFLLAGKAKRARSVNPHFASSLPLVRKIAHCETLYARHGLSTLFRITPFAQPPELDAVLESRGYVPFDRTLVQIASLRCAPAMRGDPEVALSSPLVEGFVEAVGEMRGSPGSQRDAHLERLVQSPLDVHAVVARREGRVVGVGLVSIDDDCAGVFDVVTHEAHRRSGVATALVSTLLARAWERGVKHAYLQVSADNAPALALYRAFGFATSYAYHYRARPHEVE
jgi:ribosomal protein S18 acetylase RimI-like enzyme